MFSDCTASSTLLNSSASALREREQLADLIQHTGQHVKLVTLNGVSPGPLVQVPLGAEVLLRVFNRLESEAVTLHVHGLDKRGLWFTDGVAFVQQCPIVSGAFHEYRWVRGRRGCSPRPSGSSPTPRARTGTTGT